MGFLSVGAICFALHVRPASLMWTAAYAHCKINLTSLESVMPFFVSL